MRIVRSMSFEIPVWAAVYFEYGTEATDSMTEEDIAACDRFFEKHGLASAVLEYSEEESGFSPCNDVTGWVGDDVITMTATWLE